jgi:hypothetical protein
VKYKIYLLFLSLFFVQAFEVLAQIPSRIPPIRPTGQQNTGQSTDRKVLQEGNEGDEKGRKKLIDDSTKMVFGPKTTLYFIEEDVKKNRIRKYEVDTLLNNFHYYEPNAKSGWRYQDLGNIGSAAIPIFPQMPHVIGTTSGFHAYDIYFKSPENNRYFDTKSPYTNMSAFFGGGNRNMLDIVFARNVNSNWNLGFNYHTIRARKTLNPNARDDHFADQNAYSFHSNFKSKNEKYFALFAFSRMRHLVREQGGIIPLSVDSTSLPFAYEDAKVWLRNSRAIELRQDYRLYHQFSLLKGLQVYHILDKKKQSIQFTSNLSNRDGEFFKFYDQQNYTEAPFPPFFNPSSTNNLNHFSAWTNEAGLKGDLGVFYFNAFTKFRNGRLTGLNYEKNFSFNELYVGGNLRGDLNEKWSFEGDLEYLLPGAFKIQSQFISPFLEASYIKSLYKPTAMQQLYVGNHHIWENDFSNIGADEIKGILKADFKKIKFRPGLTLSRINNFVYFNSSQQAEQADGQIYLLMPSLNTSFNLGKKFFWENEIIYNLKSGDAAEVFRIPELFINSRIYFESPMFDENLFIQIGLNGRYRSDYFANAYSPAIQQYYLQNQFNVYAYPVVDFYLNARINRTRILLRYNHLNANRMSRPGYYVTPDYTGLKGVLDIGISWPLFD